MLTQERRQRVLDLVSRKGFVGLAELAKAVKVSESTLRRDLDHWDEQGLLKRIRGTPMPTVSYLGGILGNVAFNATVQVGLVVIAGVKQLVNAAADTTRK